MTQRAYPIALATLLLSLMTAPAQAATASRSSSFVYDPASGLLTKEIIEPGNSQLCLVTEYTYDAYGNKTSVTTRNCNGSTGEAAAPVAGSDAVFVSRTDTVTYTYNADGSATTLTANALGHSETKQFESAFGNVVGITGPNNLTTSWTYDTFGRKTQEARADGTTTVWSYVLYNASWPYFGHTWLAYYTATTQSGISRPSYTYYDQLNRKLLSTRRNMADTDWIDEGNTLFDSYGRVSKTYLPYERTQFANAKFATYIYDILGRVLTQTASNNGVTTTAYAGLTTTVTNALNQTKTTVKNSQGQTVTITDAQNKTIGYTYDPFGNLTQTTDALGNVTTLSYDARGRKTGMVDPDMGTWSYAYNALGELIRQVDAKSQTVTMAYDKLGRMTSRNEPDLTSTWAYDTATKGIGKLTSATSGNGYSRTHSYDGLGRLSGTSTVIDNPAAPYVTSTTYDSAGRVLIQTYPASAGYPTGFAVKNIYSATGYLIYVVNAATPTTVYWAANAIDAMGHLTQQTYGNGIVTQQIYDPATGRLTNQYAGAGNAVQNMSYTYDTLGNLSTRTDVNQNLVETYLYDTLNRLTTATAVSGAVNTTTTFAYNAIGNLTSKSDVGAYTYNVSGGGSIRPHAVASITGTVNGVVNPAYTYDANGNMTAGAGRTTTWTSFNIPSQITSQTPNGAKTAAFWYNPEHERIKELQADQSIVITLSPRYDTGLHFEKKYIATNGALTGAVEYEHYLYAGGLMFGKYITVTQTDGVTQASTALEYYSKDNLGSIVAITDQTGAVTQRLSYDPWGKRRYPNGTADPNGLLNNPDMYHGYTGHEMLDDVGLIHMNGRLYDPVMARFVSADPYIQDPLNLQSFNRYTYVWNNPLTGADPSGFVTCEAFSQSECDTHFWGWVNGQPVNEVNTSVGSWLSAASDQNDPFNVTATRIQDPVYGPTVNILDSPSSPMNFVREVFDTSGSTAGFYSMLNWSNSINSVQQSMADWAVKNPAFEYASLAAIAATEAFVPANILEANPFGKVMSKSARLTNVAKGVATPGDKVYRVWGDGAGANGRSWSRTDPRTVENYRDAAGLPNQNSGRFVTEGTLTNTKGVVQRDALSLHGNKGGLDELVVPDPAKQIRVDRVSGANPEF